MIRVLREAVFWETRGKACVQHPVGDQRCLWLSRGRSDSQTHWLPSPLPGTGLKNKNKNQHWPWNIPVQQYYPKSHQCRRDYERSFSRRWQSIYRVHADARWRGIQQANWRGVTGRRVYRMLFHRNAEEHENMIGLLQLKISHELWTKSKTSLMTLLSVMVKSYLNPNAKQFVPEVNTKSFNRQGPSFGGCSIISPLWRQY